MFYRSWVCLHTAAGYTERGKVQTFIHCFVHFISSLGIYIERLTDHIPLILSKSIKKQKSLETP